MSAFDYDVLVIGTGPAGEGAAMMATKHGKRVAIIDERPVVGGNCTHMGPSLQNASPCGQADHGLQQQSDVSRGQ